MMQERPVAVIINAMETETAHAYLSMANGVTGLQQQLVQLPAVVEHLRERGHAIIRPLIPAAMLV